MDMIASYRAGRRPAPRLAAADQGDDLQAVAVGQLAGGVLGARDNVQVQFDGDATAWQLQSPQQLRNGDRLSQLSRLSVDDDGHKREANGGYRNSPHFKGL